MSMTNVIINMKKVIMPLLMISLLCIACSKMNKPLPDSVEDTTTATVENAQAKDKPKLFPFLGDGDKWGYINSCGKVIIEQKYEYAVEFSEGLAAVIINEKYGFINEKGTMVIEPTFSTVNSFSEGLAGYVKNGKCGFINRKGDVVIEAEYDYIGDFSEGLAYVVIDDKYGYIDKTGKEVIKPQFDYAFNFSEGLAHVVNKDKSGYIDKNGNYVIGLKYASADWLIPEGNFVNGLAPAAIDSDAKWGYINKKGEYVIEPQFEYAHDFSEGLASVSVNGKWGYIDSNGNFIIKPQYEAAYPFSEGLGMVKVAGGNDDYIGNHGYIDKQGKMVIEPIYTRATDQVYITSMDFCGGVARVLDGKYPYGYIDKNGKYIWKPDGSDLSDDTNANNNRDNVPGQSTVHYEVKKVSYSDKDVKISYPQIINSSDSNKQKKINKLIEEEISQIVNSYKENEEEYQLEINYEIKWKSSNLLSIQYWGYGYIKGTAHPNNLFFTTNININTANTIKLKDLVNLDENFVERFKKGKYKAWDSDLELEASLINDILADFTSDDLIKYFGEEESSFFYFTKDSLGISLGISHALGDHMELEIKYQDIAKNIKVENEVWKDFKLVYSK